MIGHEPPASRPDRFFGDHRFSSSTTSSDHPDGTNRFTRSGIDRVAGIYVSGEAGVILASAGGDLTLTAAQLRNAGRGITGLNAGGALNLATLQEGSSQRINWSASNHLHMSSGREVGSVVEGGGALTLEAQNGIYLRAAQVNAQGALRLHAGGDVLLQAGQSSQSLAEGHQSSSRGLLSRSTTTTRSSSERRTAQASVLQGQSVAVTGRNVVSVGTRFESTGGALHIEGADDTLLYATQDYQRSASSSQTSRRILGVSADTSNHSSSSAQTVAVRSALISDQAVRIGVGERTELVGASVQAPQIAFVRSQGAASDAAGALHLGAAQEADQNVAPARGAGALRDGNLAIDKVAALVSWV